MAHAYATTLHLRAALGDPSVAAESEANLLRALEAASVAVDDYAGRTFQPYSGVVYPDLTGVRGRGRLYTPDFLSLTEVAEDDGTGAYATIWATTDYLAFPYSAPAQQKPYIALERAYAGNQTWPYYPNWLRLTGLFGYWERLVDTGIVVEGAIDDGQVEIELPNQTPPAIGLTIRLDAEQMYVTAMEDTGPDATMTVERGVNGTTAAAHLADTAIYAYTYPASVVEATLAAAQMARGGALTALAGGVRSRRAGDLAIEYGAGSSAAGSGAAFDFSPWLGPYRRRTLFS